MLLGVNVVNLEPVTVVISKTFTIRPSRVSTIFTEPQQAQARRFPLGCQSTHIESEIKISIEISGLYNRAHYYNSFLRAKWGCR